MKKLSIEDKAKRYDEAIKRAKEWSKAESGYYTPKERCEKIFPELKESEDERIRKEIIEQINLLKSATLSDLRDKQFDSWIAWLEKQGEQKPAEWHREDEQNLNVCLGYIPDEFLRRWLMDVIHVKYDKPADKVIGSKPSKTNTHPYD